MKRHLTAAGMCLAAFFGVASAQPTMTEADPEISAGAQGAISSDAAPSAEAGPTSSFSSAPTNLGKFYVDKVYDSMKFDDNPVENGGFRFIPPDPSGAAGHSRIVAVVNSMIESRTKSGQFKWRDSLADFFAPLTPAAKPFDPKIVYDDHQKRFVVVALEQITGTASVSPSNVSRILLAVSKNQTPNSATAADWNYFAINSKQAIPRPVTLFDHWADYPGFEVDEEAIYVTANMFTFVPFGSFGGVRLWIVPKGAGTGGFYDGGPGSVTVHNPYTAPGSVATTTMPAEIRSAGGAGPGIGTYLVSYSGLSDGVDEYVQVVRVNNPLGAVSFTQEFINFGNVENFASFPDAPQLGTAIRIETNDRRALDAVWHNGALWLVAEMVPFVGANSGQVTAHYWKLNTSAVTDSLSPAGLITLDQRAEIGGEEIAAGAFTYFPSVAVNKYGSAAFGYSASAPSIYAGAFVSVRGPIDAPGTVRAAETVQDGLAPYNRTFSNNPAARNRWGDYSGISVDPANDDNFWIFNEYADTPGSPTVGFPGVQDGRWGTAWARGKFVAGPKN